jgi:hypothetical protein
MNLSPPTAQSEHFFHLTAADQGMADGATPIRVHPRASHFLSAVKDLISKQIESNQGHAAR